MMPDRPPIMTQKNDGKGEFGPGLQQSESPLDDPGPLVSGVVLSRRTLNARGGGPVCTRWRGRIQ